MGFVKIAAGIAILFIPIPGARPMGISIAVKGALDAATAIGHAEIENSQSEPQVGISIGAEF